MGTDIYGRIEVRHPNAGTEWYDGEPWLAGLDLDPLYSGRSYSAFACLFGVRNSEGWEPVAAARGCPSDASSAFLTEYRACRGSGEDDLDASWVTWGELRDLDMSVMPARGFLRWINPLDPVREEHTAWVDSTWPDEVVTRFGVPPVGDSPADLGSMSWESNGTAFTYEHETRSDVLGPGSGWEHVFAVMNALANRFEPDGVRLVAYFL